MRDIFPSILSRPSALLTKIKRIGIVFQGDEVGQVSGTPSFNQGQQVGPTHNSQRWFLQIRHGGPQSRFSGKHGVSVYD